MAKIAFIWPGLIWAALLVPVLMVVYIWAQRRRRALTVRYSSLSLMRSALPRYSWWRRHLPALLVLVAVAGLLIALTRPVSVISVPGGQKTIVLAIDVSRSMCSTDVNPNRLEAAKAAALSFVKNQDARTQVGIVAFSGFAELIQPPTTDRQALEAAIKSLITGRRTAIGSGILEAIDAVSEVDPDVRPTDLGAANPAQLQPPPTGAYAPDIIVLLTDGASNTGPLPLDAAGQAADRGLRVYAIGFGTPQGGEFPNCSSGFIGNEPFILGGNGGFRGGGFGGGGFIGGGRFRRGIDEATLKQVAAMTGAEYYSAESAGELQHVFQTLPTNTIVKHETTELTAFLVFGALLLVILAFLLSMLWHPLS
jgi:Ca-activated chloride channel family protein